MRFNTLALTLATAGTLAAAQHNHGHRRLHRRADDTVIEYELNGVLVSEAVVCEGIADGTLEWADGIAPSGACESSSATATAASTAAATTVTEIAPAISVGPFSYPATTAAATTTSAQASSGSSTSSSAAAASGTSTSSTSTGIDADFPDGEISCSDFPSDYGAVALDYLGLGGWSGIQYVTISDDVVTEIVTGVSGDSCTSGAMCSYACPAGYQKSQWPSTQGSTGQSVGGIKCKDGKLYLTNSDLSSKLCIPGVGGVYVENTLSEVVAVCRTDYPGTESETIPLSVAAGSTEDLTCPNGTTYYKWEGEVTSAQYYINPKGVSTKTGCQWGTSASDVGNWAPMNMGVGESDGKWLSLFPNTPTTTATLDFNVKIKGDDLSGECYYEDGVFYDADGEVDDGCTVSSSLFVILMLLGTFNASCLAARLTRHAPSASALSSSPAGEGPFPIPPLPPLRSNPFALLQGTT
ncbi:hypothetical protein ASPZODRAFT_64691 [Penicilliopsis zonata CBS 506.65]|uniref:SUN domain-containing protein n=1 Tax=Penicilliopsis zonata CBS 506.65 TaxID=1073090 RepID=A0A1L9SIV9_9EURO|nr:hypothetical protein ASPZODRAFT_64691 [Penicilliopsis zonata CBS 506.65]OJJ47023.1 hypothetical protein ASPZODRAFT_64691 [Penicilliopsis zonata CBS 506.65]